MTQEMQKELVVARNGIRYSMTWEKRDKSGSKIIASHGIDSEGQFPVPRVGETIEVIPENGTAKFGGKVVEIQNTVYLYKTPPSALQVTLVRIKD